MLFRKLRRMFFRKFRGKNNIKDLKKEETKIVENETKLDESFFKNVIDFIEGFSKKEQTEKEIIRNALLNYIKEKNKYKKIQPKLKQIKDVKSDEIIYITSFSEKENILPKFESVKCFSNDPINQTIALIFTGENYQNREVKHIVKYNHIMFQDFQLLNNKNINS